ncbi:MAG: DUF1919 domain-containing protein [Lachnospiraceae bacterium]
MAFDRDIFFAHIREPIAWLLYARKMRRQLKNKNFTILSCNCAAGIIYHRYNQPFLSPTINLWIEQNDFLKFVSDLDFYLAQELHFIETDAGYPVAECGDIKIWFNHYTSEKDAEEKWNSRKNRINRKNLFILMSERDGITREDILKLGEVPCKNRVIFTSHQYEDIPYACFLPPYEGEEQVGYYLQKNPLTDKTVMEKYFDFTEWLNQ